MPPASVSRSRRWSVRREAPRPAPVSGPVIVALVRAATGTAAAVALAHGAWSTVLALVALPAPRSRARAGGQWRLAVIVPAHDEERLVGNTIHSLLATPHHPRPEIVVVADNCTDSTAAIARNAGVTVLERRDTTRRGKSYALDHAIAHLRARSDPPDAVVVVDADTEVSPAFFAAIAAALDTGEEAVQVHYAAAPGDTPLARLRALALALVHWTRPLGAARLGLGTTLKGNGMAFRWPLVADGFAGSGIVEDAAMTLALAERGVAVAFAPGATVRGYMAASYASARVQDERWEGGRSRLALPALAAAGRAAVRGDRRVAGGALELATLPLSAVVLLAGGSAAAAIVGLAPRRLALLACAAVTAGVVLGLAAARARPGDLVALVHAPRFVLHKASVYAKIVAGRTSTAWQRTSRDGNPAR